MARKLLILTPAKPAVFPLFMRKILLGALFFLPLMTLSAADAPKKPNIIFILGDDVGLGDIGFSGADNYKTPNLDALASGGTRYPRA